MIQSNRSAEEQALAGAFHLAAPEDLSAPDPQSIADRWGARRRRRRVCGTVGAVVAVAAVVGIVTSIGFGSTPQGADPASQGGSPVIAVQGWDGYPTAEVIGPLRLVDGCLLVGDAVAFWPDGTSWDAATRSVVFESAEPVAVGEQFTGGGGYYTKGNLDGLDGLDVDSVVECLDRTDSVEVVLATPPD
jgi:hypothetical protein